MAQPKKRTQQVEEVRPYVEGVAKNLVEKLYGPNGPAWGTTLTEMEDLLLDIRQVLTEKMLAESLARQAAAQHQQPAATCTCPGCQQPLDCTAANPRCVQTRAGTADWSEPEGYCSRCRRAFFPSVQESGDRPD
jgi:hypothetical protein